MKWPDYFPDNCPPKDAKPATGIVYRLLRQKKVKKSDFKPRILSNLPRFDGKECEESGLSVYKNLDDMYRLQKFIPGMRKRVPAKGELIPEMGQIKPTPREGNSHHTWWVPLGVAPWDSFEIIQN